LAAIAAAWCGRPASGEDTYAQDRHFDRRRCDPRWGSHRSGRQPGQAVHIAPEAQWLPIQQLQAKVEAMGFKVQKGKLKNACGELYTLDKDGNRVELFVDPTNGQIVGRL
jgi:hypothetical protein